MISYIWYMPDCLYSNNAHKLFVALSALTHSHISCFMYTVSYSFRMIFSMRLWKMIQIFGEIVEIYEREWHTSLLLCTVSFGIVASFANSLSIKSNFLFKCRKCTSWSWYICSRQHISHTRHTGILQITSFKHSNAIRYLNYNNILWNMKHFIIDASVIASPDCINLYFC